MIFVFTVTCMSTVDKFRLSLNTAEMCMIVFVIKIINIEYRLTAQQYCESKRCTCSIFAAQFSYIFLEKTVTN